MQKFTYIYGLKKEDEEIIRYIGKANDPKQRLERHINESKRLNKTRKHKWINKIINNGEKIIVIILEKVKLEDWEEKERFWINKYKHNNLTNHATGGMGGGLKKYTISYNDFKNFVLKNYPNVKTQEAWNKNKINLPNYIPKKPHVVFKYNGWISWGNLFGTGRAHNKNKQLKSYEETKKWILSCDVNLYSQTDWYSFIKNYNNLPEFIPKSPQNAYKNNGWISWGDFIGTRRVADVKKHKNYLPYVKAKEYIKKNSLKIKSKDKWKIFVKKNKLNFLPINPHQSYKNSGWISWFDFLDK